MQANSKSPPVYVLFKFGERQHMEALLNKGEVYLNTFEHFSRLEADPARADLREGILQIKHKKGGELFIVDSGTGERKKAADITKSEMRTRNSFIDKTNVYCLSILDISTIKNGKIGNIFLEKTLRDFGDTAVIIHDAQAFIKRFEERLPESYEDIRRTVEYIDLKTYSGEVGPFVKDNSFSDQRELRLLAYSLKATGDPLKFDLGSLRDIARLVSIEEFQTLWLESHDLGEEISLAPMETHDNSGR